MTGSVYFVHELVKRTLQFLFTAKALTRALGGLLGRWVSFIAVKEPRRARRL